MLQRVHVCQDLEKNMGHKLGLDLKPRLAVTLGECKVFSRTPTGFVQLQMRKFSLFVKPFKYM